ncbi:hypothetical protein HGRIS_008655 [Hohenbuehelia grisea]|uniref:F-box domain-containing protein n=1 Tax=Hohenbuehelia grisea TaxID=104357 RepID=A0ABR3J948_9AGAR
MVPPAASLVDLPNSVRLLLFEGIAKNVDKSLKALSLVSHSMRRTVAPILYKKIRLTEFTKERLVALAQSSELFRNAARFVYVHINDLHDVSSDKYSGLFAFIASLKFVSELQYTDSPHRPARSFLRTQQLLLAINQGCPQLSQLGISFSRSGLYSAEKQVERPCDAEEARQATVIDIKNIQELNVEWTLDDAPFVDTSEAQLNSLISCSSLRELEVKTHWGDGAQPDFQLLKNAGALEVLKIKSAGPSLDIYAVIADAAPGIRRLEVDLRYNSDWQLPVAILPFTSDPNYQLFGRFQNLRQLKLSLDLEEASGDPLDDDHDFAWYLRCLKRRRTATQDLARICPQLEECYWIVWPKDSEGNAMEHRFKIVAQSGSERNPENRDDARPIELEVWGDRLVQTYLDWWMEPHHSDEWGEDLPPDTILHPLDLDNGFLGYRLSIVDHHHTLKKKYML